MAYSLSYRVQFKCTVVSHTEFKLIHDDNNSCDMTVVKDIYTFCETMINKANLNSRNQVWNINNLVFNQHLYFYIYISILGIRAWTPRSL